VQLAALFLGPLAIAAVFHSAEGKPIRGVYVMVAWILAAVILAAIGALTWKTTDESTRFASSLGSASSVLLLGPVLSALHSKKIPLPVLCILTVVVPVLSVLATFFVLASSRQVWGM